jgi:hypothetical protein
MHSIQILQQRYRIEDLFLRGFSPLSTKKTGSFEVTECLPAVPDRRNAPGFKGMLFPELCRR